MSTAYPPAPELPPRRKPRVDNTRDAYRRLGVSPDDVARQPSIRHELARIGRDIQRAANVPASPYYYLSISDAPEARAVLDAYYSVSDEDRRRLPIEAFCIKAGATTTSVYDAVLVAMQRSNRLVSAAIASATHPRVIRDTIDIATSQDPRVDVDVKLRAQVVMHRIVGALPVPRHSQTIVVSANAASNAQAGAAVVGAAPPPEQTIRRLSERLNALRPGAAPTVPALPPVVASDLLRPVMRPPSAVDMPFAPRREMLRREVAPLEVSPAELAEDEEGDGDL